MADLKETTINIADYIPAERMTEIAEEELRKALFRCLSKEDGVRRVLSNLSFEYVYKLIDEAWGEANFKAMLKERIEDTLRQDENFREGRFNHVANALFRDSRHGNTKSPALELIDEAVKESKPLIRKRVEEIIKNYPFRELKEEICDTIYECIEKKLTTPSEPAEQSEPADDGPF